MRMSWWGCRVFAGGFAALAASSALGDETAALPETHDVMPLPAVLDRVMPVIEGEIGATKLIREGGVWVYVISFFDEDGARRELKVNAVTAAILGINVKPK